MSKPIDLGRICMCLIARDLDLTAAFYKKLGFRSTGQDPPAERKILRQGVTVLAFFDFLRYNMVNFRAASIHALVTELTSRGFQCWEHNTPGPELQLRLDDEGNPLPDNECGSFTVVDPDGFHLFFNTHPPEREPYENGQWVPDEAVAADMQKAGNEKSTLGAFIYRLDVQDLRTSVAFYENLGLSVLDSTEGSATMGSRHSHMSQDPTSFPIRLRQADESGSTLLFRSENPQQVADSIRSVGVQVSASPEGPVVTDPDQRQLLLVAADGNPALT